MKNVIVGQSGGPTSVINSSLLGVYKTAKDRGADKVYGMVHGIKGLLDRDIVDLSTRLKNDLDMDLLKRTPSSFLGSCRYKLPDIKGNEDTYDKIFAILKELDIYAFFYIGGNDSMDTIMRLTDYGQKIKSPIRFIGVPKTIDNDLAITDHTPGYGSAAKYIAATTKEIIRDGLVYDYPVVSVIEVMGRNAGWLTAASALGRLNGGGAPDLIYLCERPFDVDQFLNDVREKMAEKHSVIIAVSEGLRNEEGDYVTDSLKDRAADAFGHKILAGASRFLEEILRQEIGCKVRSIELNVMQRCASHLASAADIHEARLIGLAAADYAISGGTGKMACLQRVSNDPYRFTVDFVDITKIANRVKTVPEEWINEAGNDVTQEMIDYLLPLIQGELPCTYKNGVPVHLRLY